MKSATQNASALTAITVNNMGITEGGGGDMNLYLISQDINDDYDTYDSAVVAAESEDDARTIHPDSGICGEWDESDWWSESGWLKYSDIDKITVELIGTTDRERGVVLASFNAG